MVRALGPARAAVPRVNGLYPRWAEVDSADVIDWRRADAAAAILEARAYAAREIPAPAPEPVADLGPAGLSRLWWHGPAGIGRLPVAMDEVLGFRRST